ncbi:hypothetical protein ACWGB8_16855 [Kitasatospora sp. NPDC054939]
MTHTHLTAPGSPGGPIAEPEELTVAVDGFLDPVTEPIERALTTLWQTLRDMSLRPNYREAMRLLVGVGRTEAVEWQLDFHGRLDVEVILTDGRRVQVRAWRGQWQSPAQRVADMYRPEKVPTDGGCAGGWGVRNVESGDLVRQGPGCLVFGSEGAAQAWVGRQVTLAGCGGYQPADAAPTAAQ